MGKKQNNIGHSGEAAQIAASQNFLTSRRLLERIVGLSSLCREDHVLEIGTGKGHLTRVLCEKCGLVTSVEIDGELCRQAASRLADARNLRLLHGDFMRYPLPNTGPYKVFANIPYYLTTAIVDRLTRAANPPAEMMLVMEKGAAKRFLGKPTENLRSLTLKTSWEVRIRYHFRREDFHPMPSVDSVLLQLRRRPEPDVSAAELALWERFVSYGLQYGLMGHGSLLTTHQTHTALKAAGLPPLPQSGDTLYIQWLCLFRCWLALQRKK